MPSIDYPLASSFRISEGICPQIRPEVSWSPWNTWGSLIGYLLRFLDFDSYLWSHRNQGESWLLSTRKTGTSFRSLYVTQIILHLSVIPIVPLPNLCFLQGPISRRWCRMGWVFFWYSGPHKVILIRYSIYHRPSIPSGSPRLLREVVLSPAEILKWSQNLQIIAKRMVTHWKDLTYMV